MAKNTLVNVQAASLAAQVAQQAAQLEFQKARFQLLEMPQFQSQDAVARGQLQLQIDRLAWERAEREYARALEEAALTGTYKGVPTIQWLTQQAQITGVLNGQQTLQGKLTDAQVAQMRHSMEMESRNYELNYAKFGFEVDKWGQEFAYTQKNDLRKFLLDEAGVTGTYNGQDTLAKQQLQQQGALGYLNLLSSVQGNPFKMLKVQQQAGNFNNLAQGFLGKYQMAGLGAVTGNPGTVGVNELLTQYNPDGTVTQMPAGTQPAATAAAGLVYTPGQAYAQPVAAQTGAVGAAGLNVQPIAASPLVNAAADPQVAAAEATQFDPNSFASGYLYSPPGTQAPAHTYNYQPTPSGQTQVYPPGMSAPVHEAQYSTQTPQAASFSAESPLIEVGVKAPGEAIPGLGAAGSNTSTATGTLTPNKINAKNYRNADAGQQTLMWQYLVDQGWTEEAAKSIYQKSLPRYGGPARGAVVRAA